MKTMERKDTFRACTNPKDAGEFIIFHKRVLSESKMPIKNFRLFGGMRPRCCSIGRLSHVWFMWFPLVAGRLMLVLWWYCFRFGEPLYASGVSAQRYVYDSFLSYSSSVSACSRDILQRRLCHSRQRTRYNFRKTGALRLKVIMVQCPSMRHRWYKLQRSNIKG